MSETDKKYDAAMELWKKAVDTQVHFNEMSSKARTLGMSFALTTLGIALSIHSTETPKIAHITRPDLSALILLIAAGAVFAISLLELRLYQKLLVGAVLFGEILEEHGLGHGVPPGDFGMTGAISISIGDRGSSRNSRRMRSQWTIFAFYCFTGLSLVAIAAFFFFQQAKSKITGTPAIIVYAWAALLILGFIFNWPTKPPDALTKEKTSKKLDTSEKAAA